jgi:hypothetical protein
MKKVLVLLLVLGISGTASATLQIYAYGEYSPSDIFQSSGTEIEIGIYTDSEISSDAGGEGSWALGVPIADGPLTGGIGLYGSDTVIFPDGDTYLPAGEVGLWGDISMSTNSSISAGAIVYDSILLANIMEDDTVITLYMIDGENPPVPVDSVRIIGWIPEPATICMLGLGSLALLRKRR